MVVITLVMMRSFMYEGSRPVVMFTFMLGLFIILLNLLFDLVFIRCFIPGFVIGFFPHFGIFSSWLLCIGKTKNRMMRGGNSSQSCEDVPVRRSARPAGYSPEPYQPPLPPPPHPPSTNKIMRMFEERRNNDLMEMLKSVQVMVG